MAFVPSGSSFLKTHVFEENSMGKPGSQAYRWETDAFWKQTFLTLLSNTLHFNLFSFPHTAGMTYVTWKDENCKWDIAKSIVAKAMTIPPTRYLGCGGWMQIQMVIPREFLNFDYFRIFYTVHIINFTVYSFNVKIKKKLN